MNKRKIINDPVHGFITIDHPLIFKVLAHSIYQRLRRIHQMALAELVYPGAVHSRFHHALGAYHLMGEALKELRSKGVEITDEEVLASKLAILLHDVGHGPYSHALEHVLVSGVHHEQLSLLIMQQMNTDLDGALDLAIQIFTNKHEKKFLYQLLSGQLDVDRMDYLTRDSFFTGVIEGSIGYDRIIKMLTVHNGELMVEEKGIYSIEKFLVARRLMYWQVYLHKTVLVAEKMLVHILKRAKEIGANSQSEFLNMFLNAEVLKHNPSQLLFEFCQLDDNDVMSAVKYWQMHEDKVLSLLCGMLLNRNLLKIKMQTSSFDEADVLAKKQTVQSLLQLNEEEAAYFVFDGQATNTTYDVHEEKINILFKDNTIKDISQVDNALIQQSISSKVQKYYLCYWK